MIIYRSENRPRQLFSKYLSIWRHHEKTFWRTAVAARGGSYILLTIKIHFINKQGNMKKYYMDHEHFWRNTVAARDESYGFWKKKWIT